MGRRCLCLDARRVPADRRLAGRPPRPPPDLRRRPRALHRRLAVVRVVERAGDAEPLPRAAGRRRRGDVRHLARAAGRGVHRARARHGARHLGCHDGRVGRRRAAGRRRAGRARQLAVDLLRQLADRPRHDRGDAADGGREQGSRPGADRLGRAAHLLGGAVRARLRSGARQQRGLGQPADRRAARRLGRAVGDLRGRRAPSSAADARPHALSQTDLRGRLDRGLRAFGLDVRDVPVLDVVPAEHPRLRAAGGRPALPADHRVVVLRAPRCRATSPSACRCGSCWRAGSAWSVSGCC